MEECLYSPETFFDTNTALIAVCGVLLYLKLADWNVFHSVYLLLEYLLMPVPGINIQLTVSESKDDGVSSSPEKDKKVSLNDPKSPGMIQCFDPSTLQHLGEVKAMTAKDVNELCSKAAKAQKEWVKTSFAQRRRVLRTMQKYIVDHIDDICRVCARDSGKPRVDALLGEVMTTCEKIRCINANGELWLRKSYRPTGPMMVHKTAFVEYVPFGVLGVIAPWNYPFHNFMNHVISGLFSGNAVVSKVSEHTSWSASYFGRIVEAALVANGHSPDLVQTVTGFGEAGAALVSCPNVDKIIFTGSPGVGKLVMKGAAPYLKPVVLELGGKDPMVFCDDVKLSDVTSWAMRGCFQNCGQNCCGVERLFVYEKIHDEFLKEIKGRVDALRQGVPLACCGNTGDVDCGAMVMEGQIDIIQSLIDDAVSKGATLHCGGKRNTSLPGQFYEPTLISGITPEMRISQEEVFGPVMCVVKVPNNDDEECIRLVNGCNFGLGSSVYSASQKRAVSIGSRIRSGMFTANDFGVNYLIQSLPFGGVNESGFDRFAGPEGKYDLLLIFSMIISLSVIANKLTIYIIDSLLLYIDKKGLRGCCLERSVVVDRIPGVRTTIPSTIDFPLNKDKSFSFASALIRLFYHESYLVGKLKAIFGLIKYG